MESLLAEEIQIRLFGSCDKEIREVVAGQQVKVEGGDTIQAVNIVKPTQPGYQLVVTYDSEK